MSDYNSVQLLRHATLNLFFGGMYILIDPMLSPKNSMDPIQNAKSNFRIPMVDLPVTPQELTRQIEQTEGVLLTHTHRDHWDEAARSIIPKSKTILCQPHDLIKIQQEGYHNVKSIKKALKWRGIEFIRTGGQHGLGDIGKKMGIVSGFVLRYKDQSIYIAGDTVWCQEVEDALKIFNPKYTILNTGGAAFLTGGPITMTPLDILNVHNALPETKIIAVHMDTVNHCLITRNELRKSLFDLNILENVFVPEDGETIDLL